MTFGVFVIDAIHLYAYAVNKTIEKGLDYRDGKAVIETISINKELFEGTEHRSQMSAHARKIYIKKHGIKRFPTQCFPRRDF